MKSLPKIMFYMLVAGLILVANKTYYFQNHLEQILLEEVFSWQFQGAFVGKVMISVVSVVSFILYRKHFPAYVTWCYIAMLVFVFKASYNDLTELLKNPSLLYGFKGIGSYVNMGIIFYAADTVYLKKIFKLFYYLCFAFIFFGIINLGKVGLGSDRNQYLYAIREFTVYVMWVFPFFLLQEDDNKRNNMINFVVYLIIGLFVLSTGARSYLIIYLSYFLVKFQHQLRKKNSILIIVGVALVMLVALIVLANSGLGKTMEGAVNNLTERTNDDTRSSQITEFLDQYDLDHLFDGVGPRALWYWSATGLYGGLDNQFLLTSWWAGLPTILIYTFFMIRTFFQKSEILLYENIKGIRLIIWWWVLACMGFAIYISISSELYYTFISLLLGLHICKYTQLIPETDIEEA